MAIDAPVDLAVVTTSPVTHDKSYIDWPAIFGGVALASAISLVLISFGSALGLSFANFHAREGVSPIWVGIAAATWLIWVQVSSFMAGGYLTGRMRRRIGDATEHESDVRDGAHGLLVWAGASILGAVLTVGGLGAVANTAGSAAATVATAASNLADDGTVADANGYFVDMLFRPATGVPVNADLSGVRGEASRIFANAAVSGSVPEEDRTYLASLVAANTGADQATAEARVDQVVTGIETARTQAIDAAEAARKATVVGAFLIAASLLISAIGAYWAASMGGRHRDENTVFADVFRRY